MLDQVVILGSFCSENLFRNIPQVLDSKLVALEKPWKNIPNRSSTIHVNRYVWKAMKSINDCAQAREKTRRVRRRRTLLLVERSDRSIRCIVLHDHRRRRRLQVVDERASVHPWLRDDKWFTSTAVAEAWSRFFFFVLVRRYLRQRHSNSNTVPNQSGSSHCFQAFLQGVSLVVTSLFLLTFIQLLKSFEKREVFFFYSFWEALNDHRILFFPWSRSNLVSEQWFFFEETGISGNQRVWVENVKTKFVFLCF